MQYRIITTSCDVSNDSPPGDNMPLRGKEKIVAYGIFSSFAARAATFGTDQEEGARSLHWAKRAREEADELARLARDQAGWIALEWGLQSAQKDAHEAEIAFWRGSLFAAPSRTAAKRCLREGGWGLEDALRQEAMHPDATPLPFGLERHGIMTQKELLRHREEY